MLRWFDVRCLRQYIDDDVNKGKDEKREGGPLATTTSRTCGRTRSGPIRTVSSAASQYIESALYILSFPEEMLMKPVDKCSKRLQKGVLDIIPLRLQ